MRDGTVQGRTSVAVPDLASEVLGPLLDSTRITQFTGLTLASRKLARRFSNAVHTVLHIRICYGLWRIYSYATNASVSVLCSKQWKHTTKYKTITIKWLYQSISIHTCICTRSVKNTTNVLYKLLYILSYSIQTTTCFGLYMPSSGCREH
jgi:hypothetical protein